ncbi:MAG TPA: prolyl aminopeptidase [Azospirillaceae bacterium]|nr:prolyl aminopeptidase [Azospirillaceae bacterium]
MARGELFPPIDPFQTGYLKAPGGLHTLYWEQSGNPHGVPVAFLHGGPGAGASPTHRRFFDPAHYRIIIMDQRGAGRSTPLGETRDNDIPHLLQDLEQLRTQLGIERWHLFGGSWGSTLALAYAQTYPDRVLGMILRGIFLMRRSEIDWFLYEMRTIFPEAWAAFSNHIPAAERGDLLEAYHARLNSPDPQVRRAAARAWSMYEGSCSTLLPSPELVSASGEDGHALGLARIEAHFFRNNIPERENRFIEDIPKIRHIPAVIVQGRYDIVCPPRTADDLHRAWPEADYIIVPDAGHSAMEPGVRAALVAATERFKMIA